MSDYETDFYTWTQTQAAASRAQESKTLDWTNLAEEIESLGNEQRHAVRSRLRMLLWQLLKWRYQPDHRSPSWRVSVMNARDEIEARLESSPSLWPQLPELVGWAYPPSRRLESDETGLPLATFPETCPWPVAQVLDGDFWPEGAA